MVALFTTRVTCSAVIVPFGAVSTTCGQTLPWASGCTRCTTPDLPPKELQHVATSLAIAQDRTRLDMGEVTQRTETVMVQCYVPASPRLARVVDVTLAQRPEGPPLRPEPVRVSQGTTAASMDRRPRWPRHLALPGRAVGRVGFDI